MTQPNLLPYHHSVVWVLVADSRQAKVYLRVPGGDSVAHAMPRPEGALTWELQPVDTLAFEAESIEAYDTGSGISATIFESSGNVRHLTEPRMDIRTKTKADLAERVAGQLNRAKIDHRFDYLVIIAPPVWLGILRPHLAKAVRDVVLVELAKEFAHLSLRALTVRLKDVFPARAMPN
jgi:protein required for attachment to host cells